ncbi:MAG: BTAD domain-containing putative transcriptional regulator [Propionibacteriaceae bacterium]
MEVGVLGPLQVRAHGTPVSIAGARLRTLLVRLAVDPGRRVSISALAAAVWGDDLPADPANALQSLVSRLRRALPEPGLITQHPAGYELRLGRDELDATLFADLVAAGRALLRRDDLTAAGAKLTAALDLWRGPALVDAGEADFVVAYANRWEDLRLSATSDLMDIALRRGDAADVVAQLEELASAHPLREGFTVQLMTALAVTGRTGEALERFEQTRLFLAEHLGTDPGTELQTLHLALLRGEAELPAVPSPVRRRSSNLRSWLTSFVGRTAELDQVSSLLSTGRLTTIVGPGGAGKTRLAAEAARVWLERTGESAWLVELAPVTNEANIASSILGALGMRDARLLDRAERVQQSDRDRLFDALADARCLLVVDNCEHLIDPVAQLVDEILAHAPDVRILATSREPLAITGESLCSIPPLRLPVPGASAVEASASPAVRLWVDRAQSVSPSFVLDDDNVGLVTDIVRRLDGLPLAIELAAARLRVLPLAEIASRLSDRFRLLTGGNRTSLPRHRTLRAVVEWSWDLLNPDERLLAERLAVFPAGASVESATAVCADDLLSAGEIPELLISLVDKSLLQNSESLPVRYRMLETIREYGVERLTERGQIHDVRTAHADHFAALAGRLEASLHDSTQLTALALLNTERDNILAALRYYGDSGRPGDALTLGLALTWYWSLLSSNSECIAWMTFVIEANRETGNPYVVYAEAARAVAMAALSTDWPQLQEACVEILSRLRTAAPPPFSGLAALSPIIALFCGRPELAEEVIAEVGESPDPWVRAAIHAWAANMAENDGDLAKIRRESELAFAEFSVLGDRWGLSTVLTARAHLSTLEGDVDSAIEDYQTALRYVTELGSIDDDLYLLIRLAGLYLRKGDTQAARDRLEQLYLRGAALPQVAERELFADVLMAAVLFREGDTAGALAVTATLLERVDERAAPSPLQGHALVLISAMAATIKARAGHVDSALGHVVRAYPYAVETSDMPIIASLGVAAAHVAEACGQRLQAATMLGASAQIRGGEDLGDSDIADLVLRLTSEMGAESFQQAYAAGHALSRAEAIVRLDPAQLRAPAEDPASGAAAVTPQR